MFLYKNYIHNEDLNLINLVREVSGEEFCIFTDQFNIHNKELPFFHTFYLNQLVKKYVLVSSDKDLDNLLSMGYEKEYIILLSDTNIYKHRLHININQEIADIKYQLQEMVS